MWFQGGFTQDGVGQTGHLYQKNDRECRKMNVVVSESCEVTTGQWSFHVMQQEPIDWWYLSYIYIDGLYKALISGNMPTKYGQTYGTNVPQF